MDIYLTRQQTHMQGVALHKTPRAVALNLIDFIRHIIRLTHMYLHHLADEELCCYGQAL